METIRFHLKTGILFSVILLTLSALAWGQNNESNHRVTLTSAIVNGFDITEARTILVDPDTPLEGEIRVTAFNGEGPQAIVPVAATPNWKWVEGTSNREIYTELDPEMVPGSRSYTYRLPAGLTAPSRPGTYYLGVFSGPAASAGQLMSCDGFPAFSPPTYYWDLESPGTLAAPDVADWTSDLWEQAVGSDHVGGFLFCEERECGTGSYGGAAVRVVVLGILELEPVADTFISSSNYTTWVGNKRIAERYANFGTNSGLSVIKGFYGGPEYFSNWRGTLIRFDLSALPEGSEVAEAELFLYHYSVWGQLISVHRMNREWTELGASWWQPCEGCETWWYGWDDGNYVRAATDTQWVASINRWFSWDVTGDVQLFVNGAPNDGWFLKSAERSGSDWTSASFYSKETREREFVPYLHVRFRIPPPEATLSADPQTIMIGGSSLLTWSTAHAETVTLEPGIGPVAPNGSLAVFPTGTTTYILTARGQGGEASSRAGVTVVSPPPTVTLTAIPQSIPAGESATLSWSSTYADSVIIDPGIGAVPATGSMVVSPTQTTTYTITATGSGGSASASATVTVTPPPPEVTLTAVPDSIQAGDSSTLSWSSTHADSAIINPAIGNVPVNGSMTVSPNETTTYTITVQGPGGSATASATVTVSSSQPPSVTFSADPKEILPGQASTLSWTTTHATACSIDPGIGSVPVNGSIEVRPSRSTTYRITATGPGGETSAEVTITVIR